MKNHEFKTVENVFPPTIGVDTLGTFLNQAKHDKFKGNTLWQRLKPFSPPDSLWRDQSVCLILNENCNLKALLITKDAVVDSCEIQFNVEHESIRLNPTYRYKPYLIVITLFISSDTKLALLKNGDLVVMNHNAGIVLLGGILPIFGASPVPTESIYQRL